MSTKMIDVIGGARPNFIKLAALFAVRKKFPRLRLRFIHTGQHYDFSMSDIFIKQLDLPQPAHHLNVGSGSHAVQTAEIMKRYEEWIQRDRADMCMVVGDVNSTIACALTAAKAGIQVAHVEAGLRSFDRSMPEEINRLLTDSISDHLFATEPAGVKNLKKEGHGAGQVHLVGNVMVDTLFRLRPKAKRLCAYKKFGVAPHQYAYLTLHRPSNVDDPKHLGQILKHLIQTARQIPIIFPVHPRTQKCLKTAGLHQLLKHCKGLKLTAPLGYLESLSLMIESKFVVTDSGGIQEETTALKVPCLTLRQNTERPITIERGTNTLIKGNWDLFHKRVDDILHERNAKKIKGIPYWDGKSAERILSIISRHMH